jgi:dTDP-4-amino-4,6-dideoxygalactose transaminase
MNIQLSIPNLNIEIADHLRECVQTGWVSTGGRFITEFEQAVADYAHTARAVGCQSGTAGLHTALRILGVGPGDIVIVPTLSFIATVNPVRYLGAVPVFMDCGEDFCMDADKLERYLREECVISGETLRTGEVDGEPCLHEKASGRRIACIVPVHIFGTIADMEKIVALAAEFGVKVLEDAAEAMGSFVTAGKYAGMHAGTMGDMGVFSFNANKIITTGGGGMIVSGDGASEENVRYLDRAAYLTTTAKDDGLYFAHDEVGYNYRMLNLQAALGVSQIAELEDFVAVKGRNYDLYKELLEGVPGVRLLPWPHLDTQRPNKWFYSLYVDEDRDGLMHSLIEDGIQCRPVWKLCHTQKALNDFRAYEIEKAYEYEAHVLNLPCSTSITEEEIAFVCEAIKKWRP